MYQQEIVRTLTSYNCGICQACKGMRNIYTGSKILLVPIKEMTDVLSVESKAIDLSRDTWVRMKIGTYKGDLAKVTNLILFSRQ